MVVHLLEESDWEWRRRGPTDRAVRAFGVDVSALRRLPGGSGHVWTDGRLVLKPVGCVPEHTWVCEVYAAWRASDVVRVPEPVAPPSSMVARSSVVELVETSAAWSIDGWGAHVFVPGRDLDLTAPADLARVKEASDAFHESVVDLERPAFMDDRDDPWAHGDRLAWESAEPEGDLLTLDQIARLRVAMAPVAAPAQAVHGDILPNVLVADGRPPAVIDWPPYFRPVGFANAIAVTDALTFRRAPISLLDEWQTGPEWGQVLVRALLYRLGPTGVFALRDRLMGGLVTHVERVRPVVDAVLSRC